MREEDGVGVGSPLKHSRRFGTNTPPHSRALSTQHSLPNQILMKKKGEEFLPGDLVFAEFPGYSWPALVTQVGAKTLQVVSLVLEQDELIDKDRAVTFGGQDHLQQIMSVLTPGEQQDFSEAANSLMDLSTKSRQERLDYMKTERLSESDEGESSKENELVTCTKNDATENESSTNGSPKKDHKVETQCNGQSEVKKLSCDVEVKKLSCDVDDITLPLVGSRLDKIIDVPRPKLTLEMGVPNFGTLDAPASSEGESEIEVKLQKSTECLISPENGTSPCKRKKLQMKQQRDEDYISNAVKLTNKLLENGGQSVELSPGHCLSYDSLKLARERAMKIAGCVSPIVTSQTTRRRSKSRSTELAPPTPEELAAKAHAEHLKATRAAQKKALKTIGPPLEIVQTTARNPSRRPGRKSSTNDTAEMNALNTIVAELAFQEAAVKLVVDADVAVHNAIEQSKSLEATAERLVLAEKPSVNKEEMRSPPIRARKSRRQTRHAQNDSASEIIVNSDSLQELQKSLSPQKKVATSPSKSNHATSQKEVKAKRCSSLEKAREIQRQKRAERKSLRDAAKAKTAPDAIATKTTTDAIAAKSTTDAIAAKSTTDAIAAKSPVKNSVETRSGSVETRSGSVETRSGSVETRSGRKTKNNKTSNASPAKEVNDVSPEPQEEKLSKLEEQPSSVVKAEVPIDSPENQSKSPIKTATESNISAPMVDVVSFLSPYYLNLFTNVIKEQIENQIRLDLENLPQEEKDLILKLADPKGTTRRIKKQAYEIISKLVRNSPCQNLLGSGLPEVGPGTPPASPKTEPQRVTNKVIPQTRKRNSNSVSGGVLHNPFPIDFVEMTERNRKKYIESGDISKKHSVIPRIWSNYIRGNGRFSSVQYKSKSAADRLTSPHRKSLKSPQRKVPEGKEPKTLNKRRKVDSPKSLKKECKHKKLALLLYVKDVQLTLSEPLKLKSTEVKWDEINSDVQLKYMTLSEKLTTLSDDDRTLECLALDLFVKSSSKTSRLDWPTLESSKQKKFLRDARKVTKKTANDITATNEYNEKLVAKLLNSESRKRKRESQPLETDSEPTTKKEKGDETVFDFFCLDCFTLDYNPKQYATCHGCHGMFHKTCLESQSNNTNQKQDQKQRYLCRECQQGPVCLLCRKGNNLKACSQCPFKYHDTCVRPHMSTQVVSATSFICPYHVCGSCEARPELNIRNFVRCVRCPQSFHENHIPAGCMRISKSHILCFRHHQGFESRTTAEQSAEQKLKRKRKSGTGSKKRYKKQVHLNVPFCFQCTFGGDLICCEGCPASFHNECVPEENQIKEGELSWLCPDCIVGKKPFIGDIVWVKFGAYRWWPCQILDELDVPDNIFSKPHTPCQFPAICLGTKEFAWLDMSRVYSYEDGDKGSSSSNGVTASFKIAIVEAKDLHSKVKSLKETLLQETSSLDKPSSKKPAPFKFIKVNSPYNSTMKEYEKQLKLERMPFPCDCTLADKCSADSSCINRVLLTECPPGCRWNEECENQRFQRRQYPATKLVRTEGRGWGLIACEDIIPGTLVHEYVGEIIDEVEVERRLQDYQTSGITDYYMLTVENSRIIDAKPKANNARFMNHSCDPNCETQKWNVLGLTCIGLFAKRDIKSGEELTFDYQFDTRGQEKKACLCGAANCSGYLGVPAKKIVEQTNKETKKKTKKRRRKKPTPKVRKPESPKEAQPESPPSTSQSVSTTSDEMPPNSADKPTKKGKPRAKKSVGLPVKSTKKETVKGIKSSTKTVKGIQSSTKAVLKNAILAKKRTKTDENDIEDDLQKIKAIVNNVEICGNKKSGGSNGHISEK